MRGAKVNSGREARRMLGAGSKSQMPTAEELKQCQKHAKVCLVCAWCSIEVEAGSGGGECFVSPLEVVYAYSISMFYTYYINQ